MRQNISLVFIGLIMLACTAFTYAGLPSAAFQAVAGDTLMCAAAGSATSLTWTDAKGQNASEFKIINLGSVPAQFEVYNSASPVSATVPTVSVKGSQTIGPGEVDIVSKYGSDSISCISGSSSANLSVTPGIGN